MARFFDLDLLNALVTTAEAGSLSAAAPLLFRSQSAVSEQLRKLEEMCGTSLLFRGKSGASLTPAGERLAAHARQLLALSEAAYRDIQGAQLAGELRLAITDYFRPVTLPGILRRLRDEFPQLRLHVSIRKSALIEEEAENGEFDIGLSMAVLNKPRHGAARMILRREKLAWVAHKSYKMSEGGALPLVVLPDSCSLHRFVVNMLESHDIRYEVMHTASGIGGLHLALAAGLGVTCLNSSAIPADMQRVAGLPELPEAEFSLLPPRPGESSFVTQARAMLAEHLR